jgi:putative hydrolase of the HAD superfamily
MIESSKVKIRKPELKFYLLACQRANVQPQEVVFLDDLGINLKPAKKLGMKTIKVSKAEDALKELQSFLTFPIL